MAVSQVEYDALVTDIFRVTYETGVDELPHPDLDVCDRLREWSLSKCPYGCKIYADPKSRVRILAHSSTYGCTVKASALKK